MKIGNSFNTQTANHINKNKTNTQETLSKIGAVRELSGKDDSTLIISNSISSQISTLTQNIQNENESIAMNQIVDSSLKSVYESADKLNELSVAHKNAALNSSQKDALNEEFQATVTSMKDVIETTKYNGKSLFTSAQNLEVTGVDSLNIENQDSISWLKEGLDSLNTNIRSEMNKSEVSIANSLSAVSNLTNSYANISKEPMDKKIGDLETNQIKLTSSIIVQNHQTQALQQRISALLV